MEHLTPCLGVARSSAVCVQKPSAICCDVCGRACARPFTSPGSWHRDTLECGPCAGVYRLS
eukprot:2869183-Prymnesium_polylepis.1